MTDNIINFQDIKTELEETRHILSSFAFDSFKHRTTIE